MTDGTRARIPTDGQLADILRFVARTCLEVERGLRPSAHILRLMDPGAAQRWARPGNLGRFRGGPVLADQIGHPQPSRLTDTHIVATVVTRTESDRWGALTIELRAHRQRWHIADLQRLLVASHYRTTAAAAVPPDIPRGERVQLARDNRRLAVAAHGAAWHRRADLTPDVPGHRAARDLVRYWQRKLDELDRELADLKTRQQTTEHVQRVLR